jgi:RIO-like serine/threonine protein kinase
MFKMAIQTLDKIAISPYQTYENPKRLNLIGAHGRCYQIAEGYSAKIPYEDNTRIGKEMRIAKMLYAAGISVPEPFSWDFVNVPRDYDEAKKAFIMEFIPGELISELSHRIKYQVTLDAKCKEEEIKRNILAKQLLYNEIKKAKELGFTPGGDSDHNCILTPDDTIKIIDFALWSHPDVPEYVDPEEVFR